MRHKRLGKVVGRVTAELEEGDWNRLQDLEKRFQDTDKSELVRWGIRVLHQSQLSSKSSYEKLAKEDSE